MDAVIWMEDLALTSGDLAIAKRSAKTGADLERETDELFSELVRLGELTRLRYSLASIAETPGQPS